MRKSTYTYRPSHRSKSRYLAESAVEDLQIHAKIEYATTRVRTRAVPFCSPARKGVSEGRKESRMVDEPSDDFEHAGNPHSLFPFLPVQSEYLTKTHCNQATQTDFSLPTL
jgi:hypothetical protein